MAIVVSHLVDFRERHSNDPEAVENVLHAFYTVDELKAMCYTFQDGKHFLPIETTNKTEDDLRSEMIEFLTSKI